MLKSLAKSMVNLFIVVFGIAGIAFIVAVMIAYVRAGCPF